MRPAHVAEFFERLVQSINGIVCEKDGRTLGVIFAGALTEDILGYPLEQWTREPLFWTTLLHPDQKDGVIKALKEAAKTRTHRILEYRMRAKNGEFVWFRDLVTVVNGKGREVLLRGVKVDITDHKRLEAELMEASARLRSLNASIRSAVEQERTRSAREIHDGLGQKLSALKMDLQAGERKLAKMMQSDEIISTRERIRSSASLSDEVIHDIQCIAADLRPAVLDKLGLGSALAFESRRFQERSGIKTELHLPRDEPTVSGDVATAIFRIFQECLTNVARHAGATSVEVSLDSDSRFVSLVVRDNGKGIRREAVYAASSLGLLGMRERTAILRGRFTVSRGAAGGTRVRVRLPLDAKA